MRSSLLNDIILNWEKVQCTLNGASVGFTFFQEMPAGAIDDAFTPVWKALFALRWRVCLEQVKQLYNTHVLTLVFFGLPHRLTRPAFEAHPGANTFPPEADSLLWSHISTGPPASRNTVFSVHDHGRQRSDRGPQHRVRPAGDPVDSDPGAVFEDDPHPWSDAGRPLEPWVCRHTREPTVLSRVSCRPSHLNIDRFHQPCLLPWRICH